MAPAAETSPLTVGRRIRHFRTERRLTLDDLARLTGSAASQLSLVENGRREVRVSLLQQIARALDVSPADLLEAEPPTRRAALEIALEEAQRGSLYATLGLPAVRASKRLPTEALEALVGLHSELARRESEASATPEEARRANTELRLAMQARDNYLPEIEDLAQDVLRAGGHTSGALTHRTVQRIAANLGFQLVHVRDLPSSTRSVTDVEHGRIYLPPQSIPGGHGLRSLALQAVAHRVLGHGKPATYADFLRQRLEITYFAACCLMPRDAAVAFLSSAKKERDLAIEDFRDAFGVTHSHAAQRFTNLATSQLGIRCHFVRATRDGTLVRGYENDGVTFRTDVTGAVEGQAACRHWAARTVFDHGERAGEFHQYTDTPSGTYWCSAQAGEGTDGEFSITIGVPFDAARWFRGRETASRSTSTCPDERCCRLPSADLASRWADASWPSAKMHAHILSPLPRGTFPGVDDVEVYEFLDAHARGEGRATRP
ncbi:transcriptional regulator, XRE family [Beutenbergia cavernae DSM 12333]|uniref:Transcriptional regulator, XRE family n=1 Tax=Beutenbergia cavernae (strain ATCC BAA-8 / DSM 12333 / CCUG 43141 / JCM 11478 / NBRC 16432 / NCIMB 13614 / HKI 0122) TaxID=471853 RepID=C5C300_BEUC1|nr:XRE family transcriptional regulator [Beutenbergia cavernae]ACQ81844.1 transcriptional regulator, XRE family [Beutenbergia cavernae DSM 12333]